VKTIDINVTPDGRRPLRDLTHIGVDGDNLVTELMFNLPREVNGISVSSCDVTLHIKGVGKLFQESLEGYPPVYQVPRKITKAGKYSYVLRCVTGGVEVFKTKPAYFAVDSSFDADGATLDDAPPGAIEAMQGQLIDHGKRITTLEDADGSGGGTLNYNLLQNKPSINSTVLSGNRNLAEYPLTNFELEGLLT